MLRSYRLWLGVGLSILLLFLFLYGTDFAAMGRALGEADYIFLLPAVAIFLAGIFFRAVRWRYLLKPLGDFSSLRLFPLIIIGFLVNNLLPARLHIVARAYILGERERVSKMATAGTIVVEQVFDGVTLLLFVVVIALFVPLEGLIQYTVYILAGAFIGALALCFALACSESMARRVTALVMRPLPAGVRGRAGEWMARLIEGLRIMRSPSKLLIVLLTSILVWLAEAGMFYMVALAFGLGLPFHALLLATALANLAWAILMTPAGLGSFDYFCQQSIVFFGVSAAAATSYTIVLHAVVLLTTTVLGFIFLWKEHLSLARIAPGRGGGADSGPDDSS